MHGVPQPGTLASAPQAARSTREEAARMERHMVRPEDTKETVARWLVEHHAAMLSWRTPAPVRFFRPDLTDNVRLHPLHRSSGGVLRREPDVRPRCSPGSRPPGRPHRVDGGVFPMRRQFDSHDHAPGGRRRCNAAPTDCSSVDPARWSGPERIPHRCRALQSAARYRAGCVRSRHHSLRRGGLAASPGDRGLCGRQDVFPRPPSAREPVGRPAPLAGRGVDPLVFSLRIPPWNRAFSLPSRPGPTTSSSSPPSHWATPRRQHASWQPSARQGVSRCWRFRGVCEPRR